jgi:hypothetical protein
LIGAIRFVVPHNEIEHWDPQHKESDGRESVRVFLTPNAAGHFENIIDDG